MTPNARVTLVRSVEPEPATWPGSKSNEMRVGPRSFFTGTPDHAIGVDGRPLRGPWIVRAIGAEDVVFVAMTRTGGIIGQFELIYRSTRFDVGKESSLDLPAFVASK